MCESVDWWTHLCAEFLCKEKCDSARCRARYKSYCSVKDYACRNLAELQNKQHWSSFQGFRDHWRLAFIDWHALTDIVLEVLASSISLSVQLRASSEFEQVDIRLEPSAERDCFSEDCENYEKAYFFLTFFYYSTFSIVSRTVTLKIMWMLENLGFYITFTHLDMVGNWFKRSSGKVDCAGSSLIQFVLSILFLILFY